MTLHIWKDRQPFVYKRLFAVIFMAGFLLGIFYTNLFGGKYFGGGSLFGSYDPGGFSYAETAGSELFWFLLGKRMLPAAVLWILGITVLGRAAVAAAIGWVGFSGGMLVSMAVLRYGFAGVLFCIGGLMPQYLVYVPAAFLFLHKVYAMSKNYAKDREKQSVFQILLPYAFTLLFTLMLVLLGVVLESYVNPYVLNFLWGKI